MVYLATTLQRWGGVPGGGNFSVPYGHVFNWGGGGGGGGHLPTPCSALIAWFTSFHFSHYIAMEVPFFKS